jgi:hypothetical protein
MKKNVNETLHQIKLKKTKNYEKNEGSISDSFFEIRLYMCEEK